MELLTKEELSDKFGWEEYLMFSLLLALSASVGVYYWWRGQRDNEEFLVGGKDVGLFPITISLVVSFMSSIALLGVPSEMYVYGTLYATIVVSYPICMAITARFYMPVFHDLGVISSFEYFEWRFNKHVRLLGVVLFFLYMITYMAIVVYSPALAMSQIIGLDVDLACGIIILICVFYTSLGGLKAVIWADTLQAAVLFGSFLAVIIAGNSEAGHWHTVFDLNYQTDRIELFEFSFDFTLRHTTWCLVVGGTFYWLSILVNQAMVQRYVSVKTKKKAKTAIMWTALGNAAVILICAYGGLVIFAFYQGYHCDPLKADQVDTKDQLFPLFVLQVFGDVPCVPGLFIAGVFSGALSTVSSGLNSLAGVTQLDVVEGYLGVSASPRASLLATKAFSVLYGAVCFSFVYAVKYLPGVLEAAIGLGGMIGGPVLGGYTLGMFFPWANSIGACVGMLSSLLFILWMGMGQIVAQYLGTYSVATKETVVMGCPTEWLADADDTSEDDFSDSSWFHHLEFYEVSYMWYSLISCLFCLAAGILASWAAGFEDPERVNPVLISPPVASLFRRWGLGVGEEYVPSEKDIALMKSRPPSRSLEEEEEGGMASGVKIETADKYTQT